MYLGTELQNSFLGYFTKNCQVRKFIKIFFDIKRIKSNTPECACKCNVTYTL